MPKFIHIQNDFSSVAKVLRQEFEQKFKDTHGLDSERFVWDYWHVPGQYTLLRTPAYHYFSEANYMRLHHELVQWGRRTLGCWDISPPWLSCYVEGCHQEMHSDVPHGAWAYVLSISPRRPLYKGGETLILKPEVLSYWKHFGSAQDREKSSFIQTVKSPFNRLTVFDPRLPHAVSQVRGVQDPREGRLVIHGWFTQPKTYLDGFLSEKVVQKILNQATDQVSSALENDEYAGPDSVLQGTLSIGISVSSAGNPTSVQFLTNTLVNLDGENPRKILSEIKKTYQNLKFPAAKGKTWLTVPLIFGAP